MMTSVQFREDTPGRISSRKCHCNLHNHRGLAIRNNLQIPQAEQNQTARDGNRQSWGCIKEALLVNELIEECCGRSEMQHSCQHDIRFTVISGGSLCQELTWCTLKSTAGYVFYPAFMSYA